MNESSACIVFTDAAIKRGDRTIWQHGNFTIPTGSVTAIVGTNGTGKTTMMKAELGLLPLSHGSLTVLGKPAGEMNKRIGYVPQSYVFRRRFQSHRRAVGATGTDRYTIRHSSRHQSTEGQGTRSHGIHRHPRTKGPLPLCPSLSGGLRQACRHQPRRWYATHSCSCLMSRWPIWIWASQRSTVHVLDNSIANLA